MTLLSCENVSLGYGGYIVLSGLNFHVGAGDYLCVVGENGSGKSTLVKGLLRLQQPLGGRLGYGEGLAQNKIGYLPQRTTSGADFPAGVYEVVLSGCLGRCGLRPFYAKRDKTLAEESMKRLDVANLKDKCFGELSGGQQQRVLLARALCSAEKLLIMDEPVAGLDPVATQDFYDMTSKLNSNEGLTIIMVSHDVRRAVSNATHVLHLNRKQEFFGKTDEYMKSDICKRFFGGLGNA
jgi:zinc transport system ATP-binding protein